MHVLAILPVLYLGRVPKVFQCRLELMINVNQYRIFTLTTGLISNR